MERCSGKLEKGLRELNHHTMFRTMERYFQFAKNHNLSFSQILILNRFYRKGEGSVSVIRSMLDISSSAVSQLLDKLVQSGYVIRREDPDDRRKKYHYLSERGRKIVQESYDAGDSWIIDAAGAFTEEETNELLRCLNKFMEKVLELDSDTAQQNYKEEKSV